MTTDTRPSIAELQRLLLTGHLDWFDTDHGFDVDVACTWRRAAPVLLEIAAAALAAQDAREKCDALSARWIEEGGDYESISKAHARVDETVRVRREALAKVRP